MLISLLKNDPLLELGETLVHVEVSEADDPLTYSHSFKYKVPSGTDRNGKASGEIIIYTDKNATSGSNSFNLEECRNKDCKEKSCLITKPNRLLVADVFHTKPKENDLQDFGTALFKALFSFCAGQLLQKTEPPHGIYLQLNRHVDLDAIPWEYVHNGKEFIAHQRIFARVHHRPSTQVTNLPLRIVAVVPDPIIPRDKPGANLVDLHLSEQFRSFINGFTKNKKAVKLERVFPPTVHQMEWQLMQERETATVLHFMGHCGQKDSRALIFEHNDNGGLDYVDVSRLVITSNNLRLAFLSACDSREIARALVERGVPYVIGSNCPIPDDLARKFEQQFYKFLTGGSTVEMAMYQARTSIQIPGDSRRSSYFAGAMVFYSSKFGEDGNVFRCEDGDPIIKLHEPPHNLMELHTVSSFHGDNKELSKLYINLKRMTDRGTQVPHIYIIKGVGGQEFVTEAMRRMSHLFPGGIFAWSFDKEITSAKDYFQRLVEVIFSKGVWMQLTEQYGSNIEKLGSAIIKKFQTHATCLLILHHAEILDIGEKERNLHALELGIWLRRVASERMNILVTSSERLDWCTGEVLDLQGSMDPGTSSVGYGRNSANNLKNGIHKRFVSVKEPIHFYGVPPENFDFVERSDILARIEDALGKNGTCRILALTGLGGTGKTQLMLRYCYLYRNLYDYVFWLKVDNWSIAIDSFRKLAIKLKLSSEKKSTKREDSEENVIERIHSWFHTHPSWLLLLDSADNDDMDRIISELFPRIRGTIILTTRMHIPSSSAMVINVDKMLEEEALCLLCGVSSMESVNMRKEEIFYVKNIVAELDYMPLAISLARAYIDKQSTFKDYFIKFKEPKKRVDLLRYNAKNHLNQYEHSVTTVWKPSLKRIQASNPTAMEVLKACAFLHQENIPVCLFKQQCSSLKLLSPSSNYTAVEVLLYLFKQQCYGLRLRSPSYIPPNELNNDEPSDAIGKAIAMLVECSFLTRTHSGDKDGNEDPASDFLTIPRLVQKVIYDQMENKQRLCWADNLAIALNKDVCFSYTAVYTSHAFRVMDTYISHIRHFVTLLDDFKKPFISKDLSSLLERVIWYLLQHEVNFGLDKLAQFSLRASEVVCGLKHLDAAVRLENLAKLYKSRGKHDEVKQLRQQALAIHEKMLRSEHPDMVMLLRSQDKFHWRQDEVSGENSSEYSYSTIYWQTWLETPLPVSEQSNIESAALHRVGNSIKAIVEAGVIEAIGKIYLGDKLGVALYVKSSLRNLEEIVKVVHAESIFQGVQQIVIGDNGQKDRYSSDSDDENHWNYWNFKNSSLAATTSESTPQIKVICAFILTAIFVMLLIFAWPKLSVTATNEMQEWNMTALRNQKLDEALWPNMIIILFTLVTLCIVWLFFSNANLYKRMRAIRENVMEPERSDKVTSLYNLAELYKIKSKYDEAEPVYKRLLAIHEKVSLSAQVKEPIHFYGVPPENFDFVERSEILARMENLARMEDTLGKNGTCKILALTGLGGMGKTQLMLRYCYIHRTEYDYVFWLKADNWSMVMESFRKLAIKLSPDEKNTKEDEVIKWIQFWFHENTKWLLLLDNADNDDKDQEVFRLLPRIGGTIILTTRSHIPSTKATVIRVDKMQEQEAILLLFRAPSMNSIDQTSAKFRCAQEIITELDCMPLAINLAQAYVGRLRTTFKGYLSKFKEQKKRLKLLEYSDKNVSNKYKYTVATVWQLSFEKIRALNPTTVRVLQACAFLHPEAIPVRLIEQQCSEFGLVLPNERSGEDVIRESIALLIEYSFMTRIQLKHEDGSKEDPVTDLLTIHCLVQKVIYDTMDDEQKLRWAHNLATVLNNAIYYDYADIYTHSTRRIMNLYLSHIRHFVKLLDDLNQIPLLSEDLSSLLDRVIQYLLHHGVYFGIEELAQYSIQVSEAVYGSEHPSTATTQETLAGIYKSQGKYDESEPLYQRALVIREKVLGSEHPDTATSLNSLAGLYRSQGKYDEAGLLYKRALAIREKVLGSKHPDTATILGNLAVLYERQGKYDEAEPLYQRALVLREKVLGSEHPDTATTLDNLAVLYFHQGKYDEAELLYQRVLVIKVEMLGPEHPSTAETLNNLAELYNGRGKYNEAEPLYQRALTISEKVLGSDHPDTATILGNLAVLYKNQGRYNEAELLYQRALAVKEKVLGPEHPSTATSLNNLARLCESQGKYDEAEPLYQRALAISEKVLGSHPSTAASLQNLAILYNNRGRYDEAEPLYRQALAIREKSLGSDHPDTALTLNNLAELYRSQSKYDEAEPLYKQALAIREKSLGSEHLSTALSLNNLAELYRSQNKHDEAEPVCRQALQIREKLLGSEHPDTALTLNNLAEVYRSQSKYDEAEPLYKQALAIREKLLGSEHPDTAESLQILALLYFNRGKYDEAEPLYKQLAIREKSLGSEHLSTALSLNNLAELYRSQNKYDEAEPLYKQALEIREKLLGSEHPDTALTLNNLAELYRSQGKHDKAKHDENQPALVIHKKILGSDHHKYGEARSLYQRVPPVGPVTSDTATTLGNSAENYESQRVARVLATRFQVDINTDVNGGDTPLHYAAQHGNVQDVRSLMRKPGANANVKAKDGRTPVHYAAQYGHVEVVRVLVIEFQAKINIDADDGCMPLHCAAQYGNVQVMRTLLTEFRADTNVKAKDGRTPLHYAAQYGHVEVVRMLVIEYQAKININAKDGRTPLHCAAQHGNVQVVRSLVVELGADANVRTKDGQTPLHYAAQYGYVEIVRPLVVEFGINVNIKAKDGRTPLHWAAQYGHVEVVRMLSSDFQADVNAKAKDNQMPIHLAAQHGHIEIVRLLIWFGANPNAVGSNHWTPLHWATQHGHVEIMKILVTEFKADSNTDAINALTPLHLAAKNGDIGGVKLLVTELRADAAARTIDGQTLLHFLARGGHIQAVELAGEFNAQVKINTKYGKQPIHEAAENGHVEFVKFLVQEFGADPMAKTRYGETPLHGAAAGGHIEVVKLLLNDFGANAKARIKFNGFTPLHSAAVGGHIEIVRLLISEFGVDVNDKTKGEQTPLFLAAENGHSDVVKVLVSDFGADWTIETESGQTLLHSAAKNGHVEVVRLLVAEGDVDVNIKGSKDGRTALHWAAEGGHVDVVSLLIGYNADIGAKDKKDRTPSFLATNNGHIASVRLLEGNPRLGTGVERLYVKFDEHIMDLKRIFKGEKDDEGFEIADNVDDEGVRGYSDFNVFRRAHEDKRTLVTCDTDHLFVNRRDSYGVLILWGRLGNTRFVKLKKTLRMKVVENLFQNPKTREEIEWIRQNKLTVFVDLVGDENNYHWKLRAPTSDDISAAFNKYIGKEAVFPFPLEIEQTELKDLGTE